MMADPNVITTTKSIDVGSMFLMDISVHESEPNGDLLSNDSTITLDDSDSSIFTSSDLKLSHTSQQNQTYKLNEDGSNRSAYVTPANGKASRQSIGYHSSNQQRRGTDYLSNSLDRLANAIEADEGHYNKNKSSGKIIEMRRINGKNTNTVTIVEPQPPPEIVENQSSSSSSSSASNASSPSSSSLSDESFVASGADSLTASYTGSSETEEDEHDIKDLVGSHSDDKYDQSNGIGFRQHNNLSVQQEGPISKNITATNLINSANRSIRGISNNNNNQDKSSTNNDNNDANSKPTNNQHHHHHHHHHHDHNHRSQSKRSVSASLPIQVPARQMKKDLNKLKLGLKNNNYNNFETITTTKITTTIITTPSTETDAIDVGNSNLSSYNNKANQHDNQSAMSVAFDDVDEFLEQEYNDNHHNHYPIDEYDEENLRAEENPMKLFESIQALARSLHEDTELFGSLPPKRMLESPIRSLALV